MHSFLVKVSVFLETEGNKHSNGFITLGRNVEATVNLKVFHGFPTVSLRVIELLRTLPKKKKKKKKKITNK